MSGALLATVLMFGGFVVLATSHRRNRNEAVFFSMLASLCALTWLYGLLVWWLT